MHKHDTLHRLHTPLLNCNLPTARDANLRSSKRFILLICEHQFSVSVTRATALHPHTDQPCCAAWCVNANKRVAACLPASTMSSN